ncbi:MAG: hypothetical protein JJ908_11250 [Rhizobiales bacterium]|nr:hypothetical protein [Hyphomicrobiales bacterium]MBO6699398.1 hypothetical protein [Hyphomicrobiales bacterium]MBO6736936.1 hypothetical protein [Hyphomicrobiales bacterium]MBO6911990.1 hypothetical protein [Hyphomicrobiales bacterium]MBO6954642.1 hypothetical protein [Hyphomicrobiales bacterium]
MGVSETAKALFDKLVHQQGDKLGVDVGKMLHADALRVAGKGFAFATGDRIVMKLPKERIDELEGEGVGERMTMGSGLKQRTMREWIAIPCDEDEACLELADEARRFVQSL